MGMISRRGVSKLNPKRQLELKQIMDSWLHIASRDLLTMPITIEQKSDVTKVTEFNPETCN